ncbi:hypothetical protein B4U80_01668, partial [Leptotrombidium deliense]
IFGLSNHTIQSIIFSHVCQLDLNYDKRNVDLFEKLKNNFYDLFGPNGIFLYPSEPSVAHNIINSYIDYCNFCYTVVAAPYKDHVTLAVAKELESAFGGWVSPCKVVV